MAAARRSARTEIVSVDSMSVYREMDIATAKPSPADRVEVRHHLLDLVDPDEEFTVSMFQAAAERALAEIGSRHGRPLLVGGTGLYVRAVVDRLSFPGRWPEVAAELWQRSEEPAGLTALYEELRRADPVAASRILSGNRRRVVRALEVTIGSGRPFSSFGPGLGSYPPTGFQMFGLPFEAAAVDRRIEARFEGWLASGLLEEVERLARRPGGLSRTAAQALGYRELLGHLWAGVPLEVAVDQAIRRTKSFARRQWAWFRRDPRIRWLSEDEDRVGALVDALAV
jgi:tRNA dimethylallyltransferase